MENVIILDTCVLLDFLAGKGTATVSQVERILLDARAAVSVVTVFELLRGVEQEKHIKQRKELISLCTVLDLTPPISERAAGIYTHLKKKGSLIHMEDILIAATSLHWRYSVKTANWKDFARIPGVKIEE
ncbi:MAG: type II toxin-antitoxin system VapC family toxin [Candidatus Omnitrophica bacterium]|nr:type II toxin-antitoxin system VapC family toxin [Candidatus Omnitrophota bacterium]